MNEAPLTIVADNQSVVVGSASLPALTISYTGFVGGQTPSALVLQPTILTTATTSSPVGAYPITVFGAADPNYAITYVAGTLTITSPTATPPGTGSGGTGTGTLVPALLTLSGNLGPSTTSGTPGTLPPLSLGALGAVTASDILAQQLNLIAPAAGGDTTNPTPSPPPSPLLNVVCAAVDSATLTIACSGP